MADLVKDMLELHDPDCISQVHDHLLQEESVLQQPKLANVYADCIADYTDFSCLISFQSRPCCIQLPEQGVPPGHQCGS